MIEEPLSSKQLDEVSEKNNKAEIIREIGYSTKMTTEEPPSEPDKEQDYRTIIWYAQQVKQQPKMVLHLGRMSIQISNLLW